MKLSTQVILLALLLLAGCNTVSDAWQKTGGTAAQTQREFAECKYQVGLSSQRDGLREGDLIQQCMRLRGYNKTAHFYVTN